MNNYGEIMGTLADFKYKKTNDLGIYVQLIPQILECYYTFLFLYAMLWSKKCFFNPFYIVLIFFSANQLTGSFIGGALTFDGLKYFYIFISSQIMLIRIVNTKNGIYTDQLRKIITFKLQWCFARDLFGSQILVMIGGFEPRICYIRSSYLTHLARDR